MKRKVKSKNTAGCSSQLAKKKPQTDHKATIFSLPVDLIIEILSRIASRSHIDIFHAKISCKTFYNLAENERIYKQISLERIPRAPRRNREQYCSFISRCVEGGNPEALFREGVREYFYKMNMELAFEYLRKAVASGHHGAAYILGIILLCTGDEVQQQEGTQLVENLKRSKRFGECRKQTDQVLKNVWLLKKLKPKPNHCALQSQHKKEEGWTFNVDEEEISCPECSCEREVVFVCGFFGGQ